MDLSLKITKRFSNTLKSLHPFSLDNKNIPASHLRSKTFSQTINYFNNNIDNPNLSEIVNFIKTGKLNPSNFKTLNIKRTDNVVLGKNDLLFIRKNNNFEKNKSRSSSASLKKYNTLEYTRSSKKFNKFNYVVKNYHKVFSDFPLKNNKTELHKKEKENIIKNIYNTRNKISHIRNNSVGSSDKFWRLWDINNEHTSKENLNYFYNNSNNKNKKCLIKEINFLKSELQKDVNRQKSTIQPSYNKRSNNAKRYKSFRDGRNIMEEFKNIDFFYQLSYNKKKKKCKNVELSNFKY